MKDKEYKRELDTFKVRSAFEVSPFEYFPSLQANPEQGADVLTSPGFTSERDKNKRLRYENSLHQHIAIVPTRSQKTANITGTVEWAHHHLPTKVCEVQALAGGR